MKEQTAHTDSTGWPHLAISVQGVCTSLTTSQINEADLAMFLDGGIKELYKSGSGRLFTNIFFLGGKYEDI